MKRFLLHLFTLTIISAASYTLIAAIGAPRHHEHRDLYVPPGSAVLDISPPTPSSTPPVTIPGVLVIETDGSALTLDGGPLAFDGTQWTYKGAYHGEGTITFHAKPEEHTR